MKQLTYTPPPHLFRVENYSMELQSSLFKLLAACTTGGCVGRKNNPITPTELGLIITKESIFQRSIALTIGIFSYNIALNDRAK